MAVVISSSKTKVPSISDLTIVNSDLKCIDTHPMTVHALNPAARMWRCCCYVWNQKHGMIL